MLAILGKRREAEGWLARSLARCADSDLLVSRAMVDSRRRNLHRAARSRSSCAVQRTVDGDLAAAHRQDHGENPRDRELGGFRERAVERAVRCNGERQAAALAVLADAARFGPDTRWPLRQGPGDDQRWFPVRHRHQLGHLSGRAASRARRDRDFPIVEQGVRRGGGSIRRITVSRGVADRPAPLAATAVRHPRTDRSAACLRMPFRDRARCSCYPSPRCRQRGRR